MRKTRFLYIEVVKKSFLDMENEAILKSCVKKEANHYVFARVKAS